MFQPWHLPKLGIYYVLDPDNIHNGISDDMANAVKIDRAELNSILVEQFNGVFDLNTEKYSVEQNQVHFMTKEDCENVVEWIRSMTIANKLIGK